MIFSEGLEIAYQEMYGVIDFVCDNYVVMQIKSQKSINPARVLIYRQNYSQIEIAKVSGK